jgi:AraC-like DNA-binding protein
MTGTPGDLTEAPDQPPGVESVPFDVISQMLDVVRLDGAIFLRAQFRSPWSYESPPVSDLIPVLAPGTKRLTMFHIVAEGGCWISLKGSDDRLRLEEGDVVVLPYGDQHVVGSTAPAEPVPIVELLSPPPWTEFPVIDYGGDGEPTEIVCGYLRCSDLLFDPVLGALPPVFSVTPTPGPAATWVSASVQFALAASQSGHDAPTTTQRLPELVFVEMLRQYLQDSDAELTGWLAALRDPLVGPALAAIHRDPARDWTVADLAREVASSKSVLDDRFRQLVGRPPIRYLTDWRFQLACGLLRTTELGVGEISSRVGYSAEEAFSRAFKREIGQSPARWREETREPS